mmetsp:Transcript_22406/g.72409  ORF Transcript_22406/g.72409 Transcript_22406/m.72409 type:complete len:208 (-) Transcript_22406:214-837(-)
MCARAGVIGLMVLGDRSEPGFGTASSCGFTPQDAQRMQPFCEAAAVAVRDWLVSRALGRSRERRESLQAALCALAPVALAGDGMLHRAVPAPMPVTATERLAAISSYILVGCAVTRFRLFERAPGASNPKGITNGSILLALLYDSAAPPPSRGAERHRQPRAHGALHARGKRPPRCGGGGHALHQLRTDATAAQLGWWRRHVTAHRV